MLRTIKVYKFVQEYLKYGVIQDSNNPYASTMVLVGKKDEYWRMCVNYRDLNKDIVKNKISIPMVDDMLDKMK